MQIVLGLLFIIGRTSEESSEESSRKILFYFLEEKNFARRKIAIDLFKKITQEMQTGDDDLKKKTALCNKKSFLLHQ